MKFHITIKSEEFLFKFELETSVEQGSKIEEFGPLNKPDMVPPGCVRRSTKTLEVAILAKCQTDFPLTSWRQRGGR